MISPLRIARHRSPRASRERVAGAGRAHVRASATAALGLCGGLALGAALLVGAPGVGGTSRADAARPGESVAAVESTAVPVAAVIEPRRHQPPANTVAETASP